MLRCECSLRPVVHWLQVQPCTTATLQYYTIELQAGQRRSSWDGTHCHSPGYLAGKVKCCPVLTCGELCWQAVAGVREEQLVCDNSQQAGEFKISPDIKFRKVDQ